MAQTTTSLVGLPSLVEDHEDHEDHVVPTFYDVARAYKRRLATKDDVYVGIRAAFCKAAKCPESPVCVRVAIDDVLKEVIWAVVHRTGCPRDRILWHQVIYDKELLISHICHEAIYRVNLVAPGWDVTMYPRHDPTRYSRRDPTHLDFVITEEAMLAEHLPDFYLPSVVLGYLDKS